MRRLASVPNKAAARSLYDAANPVRSITMSADEFAAVPRCPFQRNEALRLGKTHLRALKPQHQVVAVAVLPDGTTCKTDGHTRCAKWEEGSLTKPDHLVVIVYSVQTMDEIESIYDSYDATEAAKTGSDKVQSGLSRLDLTLTTPWLAAGQFAASLDLACKLVGKGSIGKKKQVDLFAEELRLFDSINPNRKRFIIGVGAGALMLLKKFGPQGLDFLNRFNGDLGVKNGAERDAVQALSDFLANERTNKRTAGHEPNKAHAAMTLALHARHVGGKMHKRLPSPVDLATYHRV